ncbi:MAG TPA: CHAT domain-containing protein [Thermoanaerobaculia bacterium]|nr:CHAT domain-containing protein [Thermoanaerobaculia bacterium]
MDYQDFTLGLEPAGEGAYRIRVSSPAGEGSGLFRPPGDRTHLDNGLPGAASGQTREVIQESSQLAAADPEAEARDLFRSVFQGQVLALFLQSLGLVRGSGQGLSIRLRFDPSAPGLAALGTLPWELLPDPRGGFLGLDRSTPIVRYLEVDRPVVPSPLEGPLRVLVAMANPQGVAKLDLDKERLQIEESWAKEPGVDVGFLPRASVETLRNALLDRPAHVLHFMGHGTFDAHSAEGKLLFETPEGAVQPVSGRDLALHLQLPRPPALVVLNACHTARPAPGAGLDPFSGVATALVKGGLLAVVAMQHAIPDAAAIAFSRALYGRMAAGDDVEAAVTEGRLAVHRNDSRSLEWALPVTFLRAERVLDVQKVPHQITEQIRDFSGYVQEKTEGFVGRKFVFEAIHQFASANPRGYFFVRGDPGIGKTSLLAAMVKNEGHAHHFNIRTRNIAGTADFLRSVCAQLITRHRLGFSSLPPDATRDSGFLMTLLDQISKRLREDQRVFVLVDALDEADRAGLASRANTLCLPEILPAGIVFVVTSRRESETELPLRIHCQQKTLYLEHGSRDNLADVEEFVRNQLTLPGIQVYLRVKALPEAAFVEQMVEKSEGNFMYLHHVIPEIANGSYAERPLEEIPQGLESYYQDHWNRIKAQDGEAWLRYKLPVIMALTVVSEPVPLDAVQRFAGVDDPLRVLSVLKDWQAFLHEETFAGDGGTKEKRYRLYHLSFLDFLKKKDEVEVSFRGAHERILRVLAGLS